MRPYGERGLTIFYISHVDDHCFRPETPERPPDHYPGVTMRATVRDVAARAGVSPKTVSNVINGVVFVRPETRERVEAAVEELQYVPNLSARGLRNGRSGAIALAFPDIWMEYSAEMLDQFIEVAHEKGWSIQLEQTGKRPDRERELLSRGREHLVDGLCSTRHTSSPVRSSAPTPCRRSSSSARSSRTSSTTSPSTASPPPAR